MASSQHPIFIFGSGRSGTTILYNLLALNSEVFWISKLQDKYPSIPQISGLNRLLDLPFFGKKIRLNIFEESYVFQSLEPAEGNYIYQEYCGFRRDKRSTEKELSAETKKRFFHIIDEIRKYTGKNRFLSKQTANTQRMRQIHALFPKAYIIHIVRDGRAVTNSLLHVDWWLNTPLWWKKGLTPHDLEKKGLDPAEICGLHWKQNNEEILKHKALFGDRYIQVHYEKLIKNPQQVIRTLVNFCELPASSQFSDLIPSTLPNMNSKWKHELSENQQKILQKTIGESLKKFGYR